MLGLRVQRVVGAVSVKDIRSYAIGATIAVPIVALMPAGWADVDWAVGFACGMWFLAAVVKFRCRGKQ